MRFKASGTLKHEEAWTPERDLNERIWHDWNYETLADGPVASWPDSIQAFTATQGTSAMQPSKDSTGIVFPQSEGVQERNLRIPNYPPPHNMRQWRTFVMVFKCALSTWGGDGALFSLNGISGGYSRAPGVFYNGAIDSYFVQFEAVSSDRIVYLPQGNDNDWHVIVAWRANGRGYARIDGGTTQQTTDTNIVYMRDASGQTGYIGNYNNYSPAWTLKRFFAVCGPEITQDEVERIEGWARATYGCALDAAHPFYSRRPASVQPYENPLGWTTAQEWTDIYDPYWDNSQNTDQNIGASIAGEISGLTEVFRDDFTADTALDDTTGAVGAQNTAQWFCPTQDEVGGVAWMRRPGESPDNYSQSGSVLRLTMQYSDPRWYGANLCSVNRDGRGNTWNPSVGPTFFEAKMAFSTANGQAQWPSFWLKDVNEFYQGTMSRLELDVMETYNGDNSGLHSSCHTWPPVRVLPNRMATHRWNSNYCGVAGTPWFADMFDEEFHLYQCLIRRDWVIFALDGYEAARVPPRREHFRDLYILISNTMYDATYAAGTYWVDIDYVRVLQGSY